MSELTHTTQATHNIIQKTQRVTRPEVLERYKYSKSTLYRRVNAGKFPKPKKDGNIVYWLEEDLIDYK